METKKIIPVFLIALFMCLLLPAQNELFQSAMEKEIRRGMDSLRLENMVSPSFIGYRITDAQTLHISASLGSIIKSKEAQYCTFNNRVIVGSGGRTNENYVDLASLWSWNYLDNSIPHQGQESDIRRALWLTTDYNYKTAVTRYEAKIAALAKQSFSEEELNLADFSSAPKVALNIPRKSMVFDRNYLEQLAKNLSAIFINYKDIQKSEVNIFVFDAAVDYVNSEGTKVSYPLQLVAVRVFAKSQFTGGEDACDHAQWFTSSVNTLPDQKSMIGTCNQMAENLCNLLKAPAVTESYSGPVLFEDQAAAEIFVQLFFENKNGLISSRKPIAGSQEVTSYSPDLFKENNLVSMMNKKIISRDLSIEAPSTLTQYNGISLIGTSQIDAEGVICADTLTLVKNGVLINLLSDRTPGPKTAKSNGHCRPAISNASIIGCTGPAVVKMYNSNVATTASKEKLKEKLIAAAKEEDLEYAYIVRRMTSKAANIPVEGIQINFGGAAISKDVSATIAVYRINVTDGSEELVSLAEIQGLSARSFKRILGTSATLQVYNTMVYPNNSNLDSWVFELSGIPASFILPDAILFEEIDIVRARQDMVRQKPVVSNPLK